MDTPLAPAARSREDLAALFTHFGEFECPPLGGYLYQALCSGIKADPELLELAAHAPATQPPPNLLFAAVHYLLLQGTRHELRQWYPELADGVVEASASAFLPFRDFCLGHREAIAGLIETQNVQTNVLTRCNVLLPGFAEVFREGEQTPLSLIEIGASAGLNLQWDRFSYRYEDGTNWGKVDSPVSLRCELRGERNLPGLPETIPVSHRCGVDLQPVDLDDDERVRWLRALAWPDHPGRQKQLSQAIQMAKEAPPTITRGDAATSLPELIVQAANDSTLCVYGTHTLYQFPREALLATLSSMQRASEHRTIHFLSAEGTAAPDAELFWTIYANGKRETRRLARCCPHGRWLQWFG